MRDRAIAQPQPGHTYRLTYSSEPGKRREATARFIGIANDPVVQNPDTGSLDKVSLHFILASPILRDLSTQEEILIDAPHGEDIHFHLWPEDLVSLTRAPHSTENTAHEHSPT